MSLNSRYPNKQFYDFNNKIGSRYNSYSTAAADTSTASTFTGTGNQPVKASYHQNRTIVPIQHSNNNNHSTDNNENNHNNIQIQDSILTTTDPSQYDMGSDS